MISNREVALSILKGKKYLTSLKQRTESGSGITADFDAIAKAHNIHPSVLDCLLFSGKLSAFCVTGDEISKEKTVFPDPEKRYLFVLQCHVSDDLSFYIAAISLMLSRLEAFERFCNTYQQQGFNHCQRCDLIIPLGAERKYCSTKCQELDVPQEKETEKKHNWAGLTNRVRTFFQNMTSVFHF